MGMYDNVKFEMKCPTCGSIVNGFQTKDLGCMLDTVSVAEVINFYSHCSKCMTKIEFIRKPKPNSQVPTLKEVLEDFYIGVEKAKQVK
jgi:hypothetical protein